MRKKISPIISCIGSLKGLKVQTEIYLRPTKVTVRMMEKGIIGHGGTVSEACTAALKKYLKTDPPIKERRQLGRMLEQRSAIIVPQQSE